MRLVEKFERMLVTGRFFCHIGPPKTASTAIQSALQNISGGRVRYEGTFQPRNANRIDGVYTELMNLVRIDSSIDAVDKVQRQITRELRSGTDLIISEEMLLVSQDDAQFERKLQRLAQVTGPYRCKIIITLREPVAALKSLYVEIYFRQKVVPLLSFGEFLTSDQARVFDYPYLLEILRECGFKNVRCLSMPEGNVEIKLADFTGYKKHVQSLHLDIKNQTETTFLRQIDALEVPKDLAEHFRRGYAHALTLIE